MRNYGGVEDRAESEQLELDELRGNDRTQYERFELDGLRGGDFGHFENPELGELKGDDEVEWFIYEDKFGFIIPIDGAEVFASAYKRKVTNC